MTEPPSPLRIAVLGCGRIGSTFAFHLARGGHDVTVVARPGSVRLDQLRRNGGILDATGARAQVQVAGQLDEQARYDLARPMTAGPDGFRQAAPNNFAAW